MIESTPTPLVLLIPFVAGFIGWFTNWLAVKATLYPVDFVGIPPVFGWQGIIPANAKEMAATILAAAGGDQFQGNHAAAGGRQFLYQVAGVQPLAVDQVGRQGDQQASLASRRRGQDDHAFGAALLLAVNIVCINLSSKLVFLFRGIKPRIWLDAHRAKQSRLLYIVIWIVMLALLIVAIYLRHKTLA